MLFKKEILANVAWNNCPEGYEKIEDKIEDISRWSVSHSMVFKFEDRYYESYYSVGATEQQDEEPYEYADDEIECEEVKQVEKVVKVWEGK